MTKLLSAVECQRQAIKESIENEGPCSDSFMEELTQELGLPPLVSFGSSSSTRPLVRICKLKKPGRGLMYDHLPAPNIATGPLVVTKHI